MSFINLTNADDLPITLNTDHVVYAEPNGSRAKIHLVTGGHLRVQQSFEEVDAQLPKETIITSAEMTSDVDLLQEQPLTDEQQVLIDATLRHNEAEEAKRKAEEQTALEKEAEASRKGKGNPAKDRETT